MYLCVWMETQQKKDWAGDVSVNLCEVSASFVTSQRTDFESFVHTLKCSKSELMKRKCDGFHAGQVDREKTSVF